MHTGTKRASILAICVLALAGCGGQPPPAPSPTTGSPAPTASASPTITAPSPSPSPLDAKRLRFALLTLADLPSGWRKVPPGSESESKIAPASCRAVMRPQNGIPNVTTATAEFQLGEDGPRLTHTVMSSKDDLGAFVDRLRNALPACRHFTGLSADGFTTEYETTLLSFPKQGDATLAFRTTGRLQGELSELPFGGNVVMVAEGSAMTALSAAGFDKQADEVRLEPLLAKALAKVE
ncbi:hypothetical protein [Tenggerimyces flavus]|uniref:Uncharacterized protein n=1 Tax=Tenggerimyces flavus TaxID=1708749 RepID=A0ABV7YKQ4_9ACTN|nr:hypothetical protein [Tenggerimyces flavus]MBM7789385.1 hypothetical protein [Tenggerimyces flavus]